MKTKKTYLPPIVSPAQWEAAHKKLLKKEKAMTRAHDALAAERRRQPMVKIDKDYVFEGPKGKVSLVDLFEGRKQLIVYHFMYAPSVEGWPDAGCVGCSMFGDQVPHLAHLHARNTSFVFISRGPLARLQRYKKRMGWDVPWFSSEKSDFNDDFGITTPKEETHGLSVFYRDGKDVYRTYYTTARGCETLGTVWTLLDLTPLGRQEKWEDSPAGVKQTPPFEWWKRHDEY